MIEINLVPDVKQELIRAQRTRSLVIFGALIAGAIAVAITVILGIIVYVVQNGFEFVIDGDIKEESAKLAAVEDIESSLTIQSQLNTLTRLHEEKDVGSRVFDVLTTINPPAPNNLSISRTDINTEDRTILIEAQSTGGFTALEIFKKTVEATMFEYVEYSGDGEAGETKEVPLVTAISEGERSYGENSDGERVLRFNLTFTYSDQLLLPYLQNAKIVGPDRENVTDSFLGVPKSLFTTKASDIEGEDN